MLRTVLTSAVIAALGGLGAAWLTEGFEVWTAEGARRRSVERVPVAAPAVTVLGNGVSGQSLSHLLSGPGRVTLVGFIYTRCPSVCIALGSSFQQLQDAMSAATRPPDSSLGLLSISFDPVHDRIGQLAAYAELWRTDPHHWRVATIPDDTELQRLLRAWQVVVVDDGHGGYEHNAALLVVDGTGRLVRVFDDSDPASALAFARALHAEAQTVVRP